MNYTERVKFYDDDHSYWYKGQQYRSVGMFFKNFFPEFAGNYWLTYKAIEQALGKEEFKEMKSRTRPPLDEMCDMIWDMDKKQHNVFSDHWHYLRNLWNYKRNKFAYSGTQFHLQREDEFYESGGCINPWDDQFYPIVSERNPEVADNFASADKLEDLEDGFYAELLVFNHKMEVAGQADMGFIETIDGVRYVDIDDFKTNEEKPKTSGMDRALYPIEHLTTSQHNKYQIQLSLYAYILELAGFTPRNLQYTWYKDYDVNQKHPIKVDYLRDEVHAMWTSVEKFS